MKKMVYVLERYEIEFYYQTQDIQRYEIVVLIPNSEHTKGNNMKYKLCNARMIHLRLKPFSISNGGFDV